jgi:hypothetical protein
MTDSKKKGGVLFISVIFSVAAVLSYVCWNASATYDSGDGLTHYFISRYSWKHPGLFLDLWGKPFFTLLSSPFSQFGLLGMNVFQIVSGMATSYFCFRIAKKLELNFAWLLPVFICFAPIYFAVINSGLTEIFFGCLLIFSVWMIFEKQFIWAAIAASLLPFVRVDAYVTVPLIAFVLCIRKQFVALAFLPLGFIVYSLIGYFYYQDPFWVIHQSQSFFDEGYPGMKGELFHYPKMYKEILGTSLTILLIIGLGWAVYFLFSTFVRKSEKNLFTEEMLLIYGSFISCLLIHTLSYCMPGVLNNLGMSRYMVTLIPSAALISLRGLNIILLPLKKSFILQLLVIITFIFFIFKCPFKQSYFPFVLYGEQFVSKNSAEWMKSNKIMFLKICYYPPSFPLFYEIDPFDNKKFIRNINIDEKLPSLYFPKGSIMIWDTHFGANEGQIPSEKLKNQSALQLLHSFKSEEYWDPNFEIRIYKVK